MTSVLNFEKEENDKEYWAKSGYDEEADSDK